MRVQTLNINFLKQNLYIIGESASDEIDDQERKSRQEDKGSETEDRILDG